MSAANRYVIAGGSAAGMAAADAIQRNDPRARITVLSEEPDQPYFRPLIPFLISGKKQVEEMALQGQGPYSRNGIKVRLNTRVTGINYESSSVTTAAGEEVVYDKLLIATGSRPYIPPEIEGTDQTGVYALRTLADARAAAQRAADASRAVMLGGGLLNLKAAFALLERGLAVTLIVRSPEVLSQLMEPADADLIRQALDRAGLQIRTGVSARRILANGGGVYGVELDDGTQMDCQMVCIGKGVRPNADLIDPQKIELRQGLVVDRYTRCSANNIYAAGDVAVTFDPISGDPIMTGLWTNAVEMGRCAGFNMCGRPTAYSGTFGILNATQIADEPFVSMGIVHTAGSDCEIHTKATAGAYRKIVFSADGSRLVGVLLIGDISHAGLYRLAIRERMPVERIKSHLIDHSIHYGHMLRI